MRSSSVFVSNSPKAYPRIAGRWFAVIDWAMLKRERAYCVRVDRHSDAISLPSDSKDFCGGGGRGGYLRHPNFAVAVTE